MQQLLGLWFQREYYFYFIFYIHENNQICVQFFITDDGAMSLSMLGNLIHWFIPCHGIDSLHPWNWCRDSPHIMNHVAKTLSMSEIIVQRSLQVLAHGAEIHSLPLTCCRGTYNSWICFYIRLILVKVKACWEGRLLEGGSTQWVGARSLPSCRSENLIMPLISGQCRCFLV